MIVSYKKLKLFKKKAFGNWEIYHILSNNIWSMNWFILFGNDTNKTFNTKRIFLSYTTTTNFFNTSLKIIEMIEEISVF